MDEVVGLVGAILAAVMALFTGFAVGTDFTREEACATYGQLLKTETQYRDGECMFRQGDGWVWLSEKVGSE